MILRVLLLLLLATPAYAQVTAPGRPSGSGAALTVSSTVVTAATASGGSATLCPTPDHGLLVYVITNAIFVAFNGTTPASTTGLLNAGDWFYVRPWNRMTMLRSASSDATLFAQCMEGN